MNKQTQEVMFSSKSDEWSTPQEFFLKVNDLFGPFTLDPCATDENTKCSKYYTIVDDGLSKSWKNETVWVNPPYSKLAEWLEKAYNERHHAKIVMLLPARTDTKSFHRFALFAEQIVFIQGRLKFGNSKNCAPFPSLLVIFNKGKCPPNAKFMTR